MQSNSPKLRVRDSKLVELFSYHKSRIQCASTKYMGICTDLKRFISSAIWLSIFFSARVEHINWNQSCGEKPTRTWRTQSSCRGSAFRGFVSDGVVVGRERRMLAMVRSSCDLLLDGDGGRRQGVFAGVVESLCGVRKFDVVYYDKFNTHPHTFVFLRPNEFLIHTPFPGSKRSTE